MERCPRGRIRALFLCTAALTAALWGAPRAGAAFSDVPPDHWAAQDIALCVGRGLFDGADGGTFDPQGPMRRSVMMEVLCRAFGWAASDPSLLPYEDVSGDEWWAGAAAAAYERGALVSRAAAFRPDDPVTREELASMLMRALGYRYISGLAASLPFQDVASNSGYIAMAYEMGLMNGNGDRFLPDSPATRAQTAAVLARMCRRLDSPIQERGASAGDGTGLPVYPVDTLAVRDPGAFPEDALRAAGGVRLLRPDPSQGVRPQEWAAMVRERGLDGVCLELGGGVGPEAARGLREVLGDGLLYLRVPSGETDWWEAAASVADVLVTAVPGEEDRAVDGFPVDPPSPLEGIYDLLCSLRGRVDLSKVAVELSMAGNVWTDGVRTETISGQEAASLRARSDVRVSWSERYACAYLQVPGTDGQTGQVVWALDERGLAERLQMLRLFGVGRVWIAGADGMTESMWSMIR